LGFGGINDLNILFSLGFVWAKTNIVENSPMFCLDGHYTYMIPFWQIS